ncbi:MAG: glycosyltransferase [Clostridium sp.]|nr:glycosyltransferase [Clostridium sp.]
MKILEINAFHYRKGGSEAVFFNTSELLRRHGHQVIPFTLRWEQNLPSDYDRYFAESKESRPGPFRPLKNIANYFYHREAARNLEKLIEAEHPDIAQIHLIWGQLTPSVLTVMRRHNIPAVLTVHDYRLVCPSYLFRNGRGEVCEQCHGTNFWQCVRNRCNRGSLGLSAVMAAEQYTRNRFFNPARLLDGLIYVSDFSRRIHEKYMPALASLPNIRLYNIAPALEDDNPAEAKPTADYFLYFGRLSDEKGVGTMLEAFAETPEAPLKIAGTGPAEEKLRRRADELGLRNIEFLGYRTGSDLNGLVRNARFVIVPSECYENNPMSASEAYAAGVPVIGAAIGGIPEIIDEGRTGYTFTSGSADELAITVRHAQRLPEAQYQAMRRAAREFAVENFDSEKYVASLTGFFERLTVR